MDVVDLTPEHETLYHMCLEDWSDEIREAGDHKKVWCHKMKEKGLRVKLALDDDGQVGGMIQYLPIERSFAEGRHLHFVACTFRRRKKPEPIPGKVTVTAFINGWCPGQNVAFERAKRAAASFDDRVIFREVNTFDRQVLLEWGIADALFIDSKEVATGPPPTYDRIHKLIAKRLRKL